MASADVPRPRTEALGGESWTFQLSDPLFRNRCLRRPAGENISFGEKAAARGHPSRPTLAGVIHPTTRSIWKADAPAQPTVESTDHDTTLTVTMGAAGVSIIIFGKAEG